MLLGVVYHMSSVELHVRTFLLVKVGESNDIDDICRMITDVYEVSSAVHKVLGCYDLLIECYGDIKHVKEKIIGPLSDKHNVVYSLVNVDSLSEFIQNL